jgi:3D (Asp-Asp-Asp) domain-containing protein
MIGDKPFIGLVGSCLIIFLTISLIIAQLSHEFPQGEKTYLLEFLECEIFKDRRMIELHSEITAYCPNSCCNSGIFTENGRKKLINWSDQVAVGQLSIRELHRTGIEIAAVDPTVIPFGSIIRYNGKFYIALDSGRSIKGSRIDISVRTHGEALRFGRRFNQQVTVFIPIESKLAVEEVRRFVADSSYKIEGKDMTFDSIISKNLTSSAK